MNILTGVVIGQTIEKNRDGENNVRMLQVEITEPNDTQSIQQISFSGEDNAPTKGDTVAIIEVSESYKIAIGIQDQIVPEVESGERKLYSQDGGVIKSFVYLKKDGQMILNGTGDYAVRFNKLKETIDELQDDIASLKTAFSSWITVPQDGGAALKTITGTWFATPLTKVIDPAKIDTIEVPS